MFFKQIFSSLFPRGKKSRGKSLPFKLQQKEGEKKKQETKKNRKHKRCSVCARTLILMKASQRSLPGNTAGRVSSRFGRVAFCPDSSSPRRLSPRRTSALPSGLGDHVAFGASLGGFTSPTSVWFHPLPPLHKLPFALHCSLYLPCYFALSRGEHFLRTCFLSLSLNGI